MRNHHIICTERPQVKNDAQGRANNSQPRSCKKTNLYDQLACRHKELSLLPCWFDTPRPLRPACPCAGHPNGVGGRADEENGPKREEFILRTMRPSSRHKMLAGTGPKITQCRWWTENALRVDERTLEQRCTRLRQQDKNAQKPVSANYQKKTISNRAKPR